MMEKWIVIFLGAPEGYGIATRRVAVLELVCRGMTIEAAQELCGILNEKAENPRTKPRA
jgi:hypothetical protein